MVASRLWTSEVLQTDETHCFPGPETLNPRAEFKDMGSGFRDYRD